MQITIDTSKDSKDEIRKVIRFLSQIVGEDSSVDSGKSLFDVAPSSDAGSGSVLGALFNDSDQPAVSEKAEDADVSGEETQIRIIPY